MSHNLVFGGTMDHLYESDAEMPENGHHQSEDQPTYRPPRRRIVRSVVSVNPYESSPSADDQRRFFPPEPGDRWRSSPWDYRQPYGSGYGPARRGRGDRPYRRERGFNRDRGGRGRFRRRIPYIEPADRNRLTARPTTIVRALVRLLYCSRKLAKQAIKDHVVTVNDRIVREPMYTVRLLHDAVRVDGLLLHHTPRNIYIVLNKPRHCAGSREPNSRHVFNFLMKKRGWFIPIGPLAKSVGGLVVVTNDAEQRVPGKSLFDLMEKEYHVKVHKAPTKRTLNTITAQLQALDPANDSVVRVELLRKTKRYAWLSIVVVGPSPRDIYRVLKEAELEVIAMDRYRIGTITFDGIAPGSWRRLSQLELSTIFPASVPASVIEPLANEEPWNALYQRWYKST
jgi:pseudouridine synthase